MGIAWTKDLETGNQQIDGEHKQLIKAADDLIQACGKGKGRDEIAHAVDFLSNYTKTHFAHEELLQVKYKLPEYETHKAWHQAYVKEIEALAAKLKIEGATIAMVSEVNAKVGILLTHIKTMDLKLAKHIQNS